MKKLLLFLFVSFTSLAQVQKSGAVYFKETIKLNIKIDGANEEMMKMLPTSRDAFKVLYYDRNESLFKNQTAKNEDVDVSHKEGETEMKMVFKVPETAIYTNLKENSFIQYQDLLGKDFLVVDKLESTKWKITGEQKKILDFTCQKAEMADTSKHTSVWFTSQIPVSIGPNGLSGLPGMILGVEVDNGQRLLVATKIESLPENFVFEKPSKGKKVGREEFAKIREEKLKEMGSTGKGGQVQMIIRNEKN